MNLYECIFFYRTATLYFGIKSMITEGWVLAKCSPAATKIVKGIWSDCLLYQKPLSHMGFFSALFAEVEQLCGRFFFQRNLLVKADKKTQNKTKNQTQFYIR